MLSVIYFYFYSSFINCIPATVSPPFTPPSTFPHQVQSSSISLPKWTGLLGISTECSMTKDNKTSYKTSYPAWVRQSSKEKNSKSIQKSQKHQFSPLLESHQKHQTKSHNIYAENLAHTHAASVIASSGSVSIYELHLVNIFRPCSPDILGLLWLLQFFLSLFCRTACAPTRRT